MQEGEPHHGQVEEGGEHERESDGGPRPDGAEDPDHPTLRKRLGNQKRRRGSSFPNRWNYDER
jgi:hypothetical protein